MGRKKESERTETYRDWYTDGAMIIPGGERLDTPNLYSASRIIEDNYTRLVLCILNSAKRSAAAGDISALSFLITDGVELEKLILPPEKVNFHSDKHADTGVILTFCYNTWGKIVAGEISPKWQNKNTAREYNTMMLKKLKCDIQLHENTNTKRED